MAQLTPIKLRIDERFPVDKALRKFKRLCESYGVVKEYKRRQEHKKPSLKNREKEEAALKRRRKAIMKVSKSSRI